MTGRSGVLRGGRGLATLLVALTVCLGVASCAQRTSARDAFGDEKLMTENYPGLVEVYENWRDGEKGGLSAFTTSATASRRFEAASRAELEAGFEELTAVAVAEGWVADPPQGWNSPSLRTRSSPPAKACSSSRSTPRAAPRSSC